MLEEDSSDKIVVSKVNKLECLVETSINFNLQVLQLLFFYVLHWILFNERI